MLRESVEGAQSKVDANIFQQGWAHFVAAGEKVHVFVCLTLCVVCVLNEFDRRIMVLSNSSKPT